MKTYIIYFIFSFFALVTFKSIAQSPRTIKIEHSGFLDINEEKYPGARIFTRNDMQQIHIVHEGVNMWCDQAVHYGNEDFIEAYGNVKMKQGDTINMTAKYAEYSGKTKLAFASGDVVLTDPNSTITTDTLWMDRIKQRAYYQSGGTVVRDTSGTITSRIGTYYMNNKKYQFVNDVKLVNPEYVIDSDRLDFYSETGLVFLYGPTTITGETSKIYCERGFYDTNNDTGYFLRKSRIDYDNRIFEGDSMYFDRNRSYASATNNIKVTDTLNNSIVKGHYAEVWRAKDSVFITKRALAITVQEKDSIYMHADTLMVTGKPEHRITRGFYNVKMYKSNMSGKADSIHVDHKSGLTQLINLSRLASNDNFTVKRRPILWNFDNQMTGDSIHIISNPKTEKLDSLKVFNNAFLISKDTLSTDNYNQIAGKRLIGLFNDDNELYNVDIIKNAEVIYFFRNDNSELVGIDKSKSGQIKILLENNTIEEVRKINQIDGKINPESEFPPNASRLRGFDWRGDERPQSIEDLFSEDPPLVLPKIKGLKDGEEDTDFFDNDMLQRIEKADQEAKEPKKGKSKKASRSLPKGVKVRKDSISKTAPKTPLNKPLIKKVPK